MKKYIIFASAALSVCCGLYYNQLMNAAKRNTVSAPLASASMVQSEATPEALSKPSPVNAARLKTTHNERNIQSDCNTTIECKRGTKLFFPANSFVDENGAPIIGKVRLVIEECYNLNEMLAAKLSTTSGDRRLETAGMIKVQAYSKKKEVFLREGSRYNIYFPVEKGRKEDFELFYGERNESGIIDWRLETNSDPIPETSTAPTPPPNACFIQINASELRCGTRIREMDYFNWPLSNGQNLNQWFVSNFNPSSEMVDDFCANHMYSQITFKVNPDGSFRDYYISHTAREDYDRTIAAALATMPPLDMNRFMPLYTDDHACVVSFGRQQGRNTEAFKRKFRNLYTYEDTTQKMTAVNTQDLNFYVFSSAGLGWINCDRFVSEQGPLVDVIIQSKLSSSAMVSMVFENERSILSGMRLGDDYVFQGVPANRNVRVVAIDNPHGSPVMEVSSMNTSMNKLIMQNTKPITLADLDNALRWN